MSQQIPSVSNMALPGVAGNQDVDRGDKHADYELVLLSEIVPDSLAELQSAPMPGLGKGTGAIHISHTWAQQEINYAEKEIDEQVIKELSRALR